jgi:DNA-binding transcriptional MerR regulator
MEREEAMLTIGQFGRLSQLSRKALRLYAARGILKPARVDPDSGYRYYTRAQVTTARRIRLLRLMAMPLEQIGEALAVMEADTAVAQRLIRSHVTAVEQQVTAVQLAARLLLQELTPEKEQPMDFQFEEREMAAQTAVCIRRHVTIPAYHAWIPTVLRQLWDHINAASAQPAGSPIALYYGPVNEEDDGPVEVCVPFVGAVPPAGEIKIRALPAHKAVQLRTFGEYNEYPRLLELWNAVERRVDGQNLASNWDGDMTCYEIWHEDMTMTIGWPVQSFAAAA